MTKTCTNTFKLLPVICCTRGLGEVNFFFFFFFYFDKTVDRLCRWLKALNNLSEKKTKNRKKLRYSFGRAAIFSTLSCPCVLFKNYSWVWGFVGLWVWGGGVVRRFTVCDGQHNVNSNNMS